MERRVSRNRKLKLENSIYRLRSPERTSLAAYWASWADASEVVWQRKPNEASAFLAELERKGGAQAPCLREVQEAADVLDHEGFAHAGVGARLS